MFFPCSCFCNNKGEIYIGQWGGRLVGFFLSRSLFPSFFQETVRAAFYFARTMTVILFQFFFFLQNAETKQDYRHLKLAGWSLWLYYLIVLFFVRSYNYYLLVLLVEITKATSNMSLLSVFSHFGISQPDQVRDRNETECVSCTSERAVCEKKDTDKAYSSFLAKDKKQGTLLFAHG